MNLLLLLPIALLEEHLHKFKFEIGSTVQFDNPPQYGVIKWIGKFPGRDTVLAGVETVI